MSAISTLDESQSTFEQDLRPRAHALSWMASLSLAAGEVRAAECYLLELLAWCAFGDRSVVPLSENPLNRYEQN
jgi:hypothetical protein|nr:hypothetical protein [Kofleriaceae bacterium]